MATFTPSNLLPFTSHSSVSSTGTYVASTAATTGVVRTITAATATAALTVTVDQAGADAAAQRLIPAFALTANVPSIFNGWWVQPVTAASLLGILSSATALSIVTGSLSGYTWA